MRRTRTTILSLVAVMAAAGTAFWIASPASAAATTAVFTKTADWGSGWQGAVTITNGGDAPLTSWKVEFDLPAGTTVGNYWDAELAVSGVHNTFTNRGWNGTLAPDATVSFGMVGAGPGSPSNCRLNGAPCAGGTTPGNPSTPPTGRPTVAPATPPTTAPTDGPAYPTAPPTAKPPTGPPAPVPPKSDLLPMTITNNTGRNEPVYLYVLGVDLHSGGKLGYVDEAGTFTNWTGGQLVPVAAPDVSIPGPANGQSKTIKFPRQLSGRMYFSFGKKLDFKLSLDGLVQPAPWAAGDPNHDILFDWTEFTFNSDGLWLNSSQVDQFAVPHAVTVTGANGQTRRTGDVVAGGRNKVINAVKAQPGFEKTVVTGPDGTVLRVLAPGKASDAGLFSPTYLAPYITSAWNAYKTKTLTVTPFTDQPAVKFFGKTDAAGNVMNFTDTTGKTVASFTKPSTANVWGCDGALGAPNDLVVGPIARTLCAAMHRSTLGTLDNQPAGTAADFYKGALTNHFSRIVHQNMADGRAYGFAFDDVQAQESLVHDGDPRVAGVVLTAF
jgi:hypothetical protein